MKIAAIIALGVTVLSLQGCGRAEDTQAYSKEVSTEVPKPRADGPTFEQAPGFVIGPGAKSGGSKGAASAAGK